MLIAVGGVGDKACGEGGVGNEACVAGVLGGEACRVGGVDKACGAGEGSSLIALRDFIFWSSSLWASYQS